MKRHLWKKVVAFSTILLSLVGVAFSKYIIVGEAHASSDAPFAQYQPSGLTEYLMQKYENSDTNPDYIYDKGTTANSYTVISGDEDNYDASTKTIGLGSPYEDLKINSVVSFTHADTQLQYSETEFNDKENHPLYPNPSETNANYNKEINYYYNHYVEGIGGRLYTIQLQGDVILESGAVLSLGGYIGTTSSSTGGGVLEGFFVTLDLNGHTLTIESGATLNAYGYVLDTKLDRDGKHVGKIDNYGMIYSPFVVEDYGGGGSTVGRAIINTMPFSTYSTPYLSCQTIFHSGSGMKCPTMLYANGSQSATIMNLIGSDANSMIQIHSGAQVIRDAYNNLSETTYEKNYSSTYTMSGDIQINNLALIIDQSMTMSGITASVNASIDMAQFDFHIPSYYHFVLESDCSLHLPLTLKFAPGATVLAKEGSTILLGNRHFDSRVEGTGTLIITIPFEKEIASGTSYGGIIALPQIMPDTGTTTTTGGNYPYGFTRSNYSVYEQEATEYFNAYASEDSSGNTDGVLPDIQILGDIRVEDDATSNQHPLSGLIRFGAQAFQSIHDQSASYQCLRRKAQAFQSISGSQLAVYALDGKGGSLLESLGDVPDRTTNYAGFEIFPLVAVADNDGDNQLEWNVFKSSAISSSLPENQTYYDFRSGIYSTSSGNYIYLTNNTDGSVDGSIVPITGSDDTNKTVVYNGQTYVFYRDQFVLSLMTEGQNQYNGNAGSYVYDNLYGKSVSTMSMVDIDIAQNTTFYTVRFNQKQQVTTQKPSRSGTATRNGRLTPGVFYGYGSWNNLPTDDDPGTNVVAADATTQQITSFREVNGTNYSYLDLSNNGYLADLTRFTRGNANIYTQVGTVTLSTSLAKSTATSAWTFTGTEDNPKPTDKTTFGFGTRTQSADWQTWFTRTITIADAANWSSSRPLYAKASGLSYDSVLEVWKKTTRSEVSL